MRATNQLGQRFKIFRRSVRDSIIKARVTKLNHTPAGGGPVFSVVIPIYDRVNELREAIDSVLRQSFKNFELILICDGSPAPTLELVDSYVHNSQVKTFRFDTRSGNACRGRNKGIELASGQYVSFLDSDDIAVNYRLERTLFHFFDKGVDVVGGAIEYLVIDKHVSDFSNGQIGFTSEQCTYDMLKEGNRLSTCSVSVLRQVLLEYGGFREEMKYREDHELWLRLAYHGCSFYNSPEILAKYRIHAGNAESSYLKDDAHWFDKALSLHKVPLSPV